jgi:hypothetical protein
MYQGNSIAGTLALAAVAAIAMIKTLAKMDLALDEEPYQEDENRLLNQNELAEVMNAPWRSEARSWLAEKLFEQQGALTLANYKELTQVQREAMLRFEENQREKARQEFIRHLRAQVTPD